MLDAVRGYLQLATGLTEVTMRKAREVAQSLLSGDIDSVVPDMDSSKSSAAGAARVVTSQVQDLADDIVSQATANRELLVGLIRTEIDRAAGRLGFVREEELAAVRRHLERLEAQVHDLQQPGGAAAAPERPVTRTKKKVPAPGRTAAGKPTPARTQEASEPVGDGS